MITTIEPVHIIVAEDRGRDVLPFLRALRVGTGMGYRYGCKVHSGTFPELADGAAWRRTLVGYVLSPEALAELRQRFFASDEPGIAVKAALVTPLTDVSFSRPCKERMQVLGARWLPGAPMPGAYVSWGMFWFGFEALRVLDAAALGHDDFEPELGQADGTLAHALERMFLGIAEQSGRAIIRY